MVGDGLTNGIEVNIANHGAALRAAILVPVRLSLGGAAQLRLEVHPISATPLDYVPPTIDHLFPHVDERRAYGAKKRLRVAGVNMKAFVRGVGHCAPVGLKVHGSDPLEAVERNTLSDPPRQDDPKALRTRGSSALVVKAQRKSGTS